MSDLFISNPGTVTRVQLDSNVIPGAIEVKSNSKSLTDENDSTPTYVLITACDYIQRTKHQFSKSMDSNIYLYTFGDDISDITISGIAFTNSCDGNTTGLSSLLQFYSDNKVSNVTADGIPELKIRIGDSSFIYAYLIACQIRVADASNRIVNFTLSMKAIPED